MTTEDLRDPTPMTPGWKTMAVVLVFYLGCVAVATWPAFATFGSTVPSRVDPLAHLWTMRWNKSCLLEGRLPFVCPDIQYPVGASLGTLPPMHFQTLLYLPLSALLANDVLCYNVIRAFAFVLTGLGTFLLIWNVVRSRMAACLGGMTAMIGTPMTYFSHGELEQITVGWFPIFLIAWLRWVDRPSGKGLAVSAALYILVAMSAPYYGVFVVFPAALYVVWRAMASGRAGIVPFLRARLGWFAAFGALTAPGLVVLFSNQIWALTHGYSMARPESEFAMCRAPFWGYLVPPPSHLLSRVMPFDTNVLSDFGSVPSYLGAVTLAMIVYAAASRVKFDRGRFWWAVLALLVILSLGAHTRIGSLDVSLPAAWLKKYFVGFRMIRVPARFNLFAAVAAAVVAAAGFRHLLARLPGRRARLAVFGACSAIALADLSTVPYLTAGILPMPACYEAIRRSDPDATFLEVPQFNSGAFQLPAACTYWQSFHGGKTSAGYTAFPNVGYDNLLYYNSPFDAFKMAQPDYLVTPYFQDMEMARGVDVRSYIWLYLKVHNLRYVVVHYQPVDFPEFFVHADRLMALLQDARVYQDGSTAVFDRERLAPPIRAVLLYAEGWGNRVPRGGGRACMLRQSGRVFVYNPTPDQPIAFGLEASAHQHDRGVTLRAGDRVLARWRATVADQSVLASPPFRLAAGLHELTIESEGEEPPSRHMARVAGDSTPFSLWVTGVGLINAKPEEVADRPGEGVAR